MADHFKPVEHLTAQQCDEQELDEAFVDACPHRLTYTPAAYANLDGGACYYQPLFTTGC